jgi:hypothetical protein
MSAFLELAAAWKSADDRYAAATDTAAAEEELRRLAALEYKISRAVPTSLDEVVVALEFIVAYARGGAPANLDHVALSVLKGARQALAAMSVRALA